MPISYWQRTRHPDDRKTYNKTIAEAMKYPDRQWLFNYRYRGQDGAWHNVTDRGFFVMDENGTPYRMLSSMLVENAVRE